MAHPTDDELIDRVKQVIEGNDNPIVILSRDEAAAMLRACKGRDSFQSRVALWMQECFGPEISADKLERGDRFLEETLELLQSGGYTPDRARALIDYVFARPTGEPAQEVGGVMVTLAAYCLAHSLGMHEAGETELARVWTKVDKIRAKQAAKPRGSALPIAVLEPAPDHFEKGLNTALKIIASIGYGRNQDVDEGHEEAYRAVETYLKDWKANKPAVRDPAPDQGEWDAAAMLRACKGRGRPTTWHMDESEHSVLIYSLKQDGRREGGPVMVNDLTIRIENAHGSAHDLKPFAEAILAALEPAPGHSEWDAAIEAAAKVAEGYGCCHVPQEISEEIRATLEPAPDHAAAPAAGSKGRELDT